MKNVGTESDTATKAPLMIDNRSPHDEGSIEWRLNARKVNASRWATWSLIISAVLCAAMALSGTPSLAQTFEETEDFLRQAFLGCEGVKGSSLGSNHRLIVEHEGSPTTIDLKNVKGAESYPTSLRVLCLTGACISWPGRRGAVSLANDLEFRCGSDMSARMARAFNHIGQNFARQQPF